MATPKKTKKYKSVCQLRGVNNGKIKGYIIFTELTKRMKIEVDLYDLPPGPRGFHIHDTGNLLEGCSSLCAHFNPTNKDHGGLNDTDAHIGDLGNVTIKKNGKCKTIIYSNFLKNSGRKFNIIGRSVVIHDEEDDLGCGGDRESLITGNAGSRIACGVIGIF
jgi:superoxide dismutase, Cu-Zn family